MICSSKGKERKQIKWCLQSEGEREEGREGGREKA